MRIGFHVSIAGGWPQTLARAVTRRCTTLQVFTTAPVRWAHKPLAADDAAWFRDALRALDIQPLFVHGIYLLNLAAGDRDLWRQSRDNLAEELRRAALLGAAGVVVHLGSVGEKGSLAAGLRRVARAIDQALRASGGACPVLLENCAGQGRLVGCTPPALGEVMSLSRHPEHLAVCLDTAHAFAVGYDLRKHADLQRLLDECDAAFGLERLRLIHANDTPARPGSNLDRHANIGKGEIGRRGFRLLTNEPRLERLPFIMETPDQDHRHAADMRALRAAIDPSRRPPLPPLRPRLPRHPAAAPGR